MRGALLALVLALAPAALLLGCPGFARGLAEFAPLAAGCLLNTHPWCSAAYLAAVARVHRLEFGAPYSPTADEVVHGLVNPEEVPLRGRVAIVTGATSGIGLETARLLMRLGCFVVMPARSPAKGEALLEGLRREARGGGDGMVVKMDLSDLDSVQSFAKAFWDSGRPLHYLVANAGVMALPELEKSRQGFEMQFASNHLGHFLLLKLLEPRLLSSGTPTEPARFLPISSAAHEWWENKGVGSPIERLVDQVPPTRAYDPMMLYGLTKALNVMTANEQQRRWGPGASAVAASLHPGLIETGILKAASGIEAITFGPLYAWARKNISQGTSTTMHCLLSPAVPAEARRDGGAYYVNNGLYDASPLTRDPALGREVWRLSEGLVQPWLS